MTAGGVESERLRLFVALDLPEQVREALLSWRSDVLREIQQLRPVVREALHATLCFLGTRPMASLADGALASAAGLRPAAVAMTVPVVAAAAAMAVLRARVARLRQVGIAPAVLAEPPAAEVPGAELPGAEMPGAGPTK